MDAQSVTRDDYSPNCFFFGNDSPGQCYPMNSQMRHIGIESYRDFANRFKALMPGPYTLLTGSFDDYLETGLSQKDTPALRELATDFANFSSFLSSLNTSLDVAEMATETSNNLNFQSAEYNHPTFGSKSLKSKDLDRPETLMPQRPNLSHPASPSFSLEHRKGEKRQELMNRPVESVFIPSLGDLGHYQWSERESHYDTVVPPEQKQEDDQQSVDMLSSSPSPDQETAKEKSNSSMRTLRPERRNPVFLESAPIQPLDPVSTFTPLGKLEDISDIFKEEKVTNANLSEQDSLVENRDGTYRAPLALPRPPQRLTPSMEYQKTKFQNDAFDPQATTGSSENTRSEPPNVDAIMEILTQNMRNDYERFYGD